MNLSCTYISISIAILSLGLSAVTSLRPYCRPAAGPGQHYYIGVKTF